MTKPDILASLIAKMPHFESGDYFTASHKPEQCFKCRAEAALDALVEKWDQDHDKYAERHDQATKNEKHIIAAQQAGLATAFGLCAAELRGRGPDAER